MSITIIIDDDNTINISREDIIKDQDYHTCSRLMVEIYPYIKYQRFHLDDKYHLTPIIEGKANCKKTILGKGSFGEVYCYGDCPIATKEVDIEYDNLEWMGEPAAIRLLGNSENIAKTYGIRFDKNKAYLYMKKMICGREFFREKFTRGFEKILLFNLLKGMYQGLKKGLLHLDIKPANTLFDDDKNLYITDWGSSIFLPYCRNMRNQFAITSCYRAPEVYKLVSEYYSSADVFSAGITFYEMYYNNPDSLFNLRHKDYTVFSEDIEKYSDNIFECQELSAVLSGLYSIKDITLIEKMLLQSRYISKIQSVEGKMLLMQMTCNLPEMRPTLAEALNHPFFDDIRGLQKFPEITLKTILSNLPSLNKRGDKISPSMKIILFEWVLEICELRAIQLSTCLLAFRLINMVKGITFENYQEIGSACLFIACKLCVEPTKLSGVAYPDSEKIKDRVYELLYLFNFELYGSIPVMYIEKLDPEIIERLLFVEVFYEDFIEYDNNTIYNFIIDKDCQKFIYDFKKSASRFSNMKKHAANLPFFPITINKRDNNLDKDFIKNAAKLLYYKEHNNILMDIIEEDNIRKGIEIIKNILNK